MFLHNRFACFQLDNQTIFDIRIGKVISENGTILVEYRERMLLLDFQALFSQAMYQSIFINLL